MDDDVTLMMEARRILEEHELDCTCEICKVMVDAQTPFAGIVAAADVLRRQRMAAKPQLVN